jgi:hypothetical protein
MVAAPVRQFTVPLERSVRDRLDATVRRRGEPIVAFVENVLRRAVDRAAINSENAAA